MKWAHNLLYCYLLYRVFRRNMLNSISLLLRLAHPYWSYQYQQRLPLLVQHTHQKVSNRMGSIQHWSLLRSTWIKSKSKDFSSCAPFDLLMRNFPPEKERLLLQWSSPQLSISSLISSKGNISLGNLHYEFWMANANGKMFMIVCLNSIKVFMNICLIQEKT